MGDPPPMLSYAARLLGALRLAINEAITLCRGASGPGNRIISGSANKLNKNSVTKKRRNDDNKGQNIEKGYSRHTVFFFQQPVVVHWHCTVCSNHLPSTSSPVVGPPRFRKRTPTPLRSSDVEEETAGVDGAEREIPVAALNSVVCLSFLLDCKSL